MIIRYLHVVFSGSSALNGKMLLVTNLAWILRIIENKRRTFFQILAPVGGFSPFPNTVGAKLNHTKPIQI